MASGADLAKILSASRAATPPEDAAQPLWYRQGTVKAWNPYTGNNTITVGGVDLVDLPILNTSDALSIGAGDTVAVAQVGTSSRTAAILGRLVTPGTPQAASALAIGRATTESVQTLESTSSSSYTDLATLGPIANVVVGPSGRLMVQVGTALAISGNNTTMGALMSFTLSGANTMAASDSQALQVNMSATVAWTAAVTLGSPLITLSNLTPGATVVTAKYRANSTGPAAFAARYVTVLPL